MRDTTDFVIILGEHTWKVHTSIFTQKSKVFATTFNDSNWKESKEKRVQISGDHANLFARLIQFAYYDEYCYKFDAKPNDREYSVTL